MVIPKKIPDGITVRDVVEAIKDFDAGTIEKFSESTDYDLIHDNKSYPPVPIICLAARRLAGCTLKPKEEVRGGVGTKCFKIFNDLGFEIVRKRSKGLLLIVCFYLAKYDRRALAELGYKTQTDAFRMIGKSLGVPERTVQNRRDDFDALFPHRAGWNRTLSPINREVAEKFQDLEEFELRQIVTEILKDQKIACVEGLADVINEISKKEENSREKRNIPFNPQRVETGKKAEEFFLKYHGEHSIPIPCETFDMRDQGCGYDFKISNDDQAVLVEVKGLDGDKGGISITSKEWEMAQAHGDSYYLVVVRNVGDKFPEQIDIIRNPAASFKPRKEISTVVRVSFSLSDADLREPDSAEKTNE